MRVRGYYVKNNLGRLPSIPTQLLLVFMLANLTYVSVATDSTNPDEDFDMETLDEADEDFVLFDHEISALRLYNYANAVLVSPTNITEVETTETSVLLKWSAGTIVSSPEYLSYNVKYKSEWDYDYWHSVDVVDICNGSLPSSQNDNSNDDPSTSVDMKCWVDNIRYYYFNVTELVPATKYEICINARFSFENECNGWHSVGCTTITTLSQINVYRITGRTSYTQFQFNIPYYHRRLFGWA